MSSDNGQPNARISVVVPVYNVDKYVDQCLTCIREQTLPDLEIIVVNDGSTDDSGRIIAAHASADPRITVVEQENRGYGAAINAGLRHAHGEYLSIVDSDDWLEPSMLQTLYALATKHDADIAKCAYRIQYADGSSTPVHFGRHMLPDPETARSSSFLDLMVFPSSIWSAVYRTQFLRSKKIHMIETPGAAYQDVPWKFICYSSTDNIVLTDMALYDYRMRETGSSSVDRGKLDAHFINFTFIRTFLNENGLWVRYMRSFFIHQFMDLLFHYNRLNRNNALDLCRRFSSVLADAEKHGIPVAKAKFVRVSTNSNFRRRVLPLISLVAYYAARKRGASIEAMGHFFRYGLLRLRRSKLVWPLFYEPAAYMRQRMDEPARRRHNLETSNVTDS